MRAIVVCAVLAACGGGKSNSGPDAFYTTCGNPGDLGNELGIGKFCQTIADCSSTPMASICSNLGDVTTFFCTRTCQSTGSADQCGTGAQCVCSGGCGCVPNTCLQ